MDVALPDYAEELFYPYRYKVLYGGRGSSKSWTVARALLIQAKQKTKRVLCAREFQNSITESVHKLLVEQIWLMGLQNFYHITNQRIVGKNGSEFIFKGLHMNINSIKSMEGIDIIWLEEAHTVSKVSWDVIVPTIRKENSEIWVTYNPENEDDPTHVKFVDSRGEPLDMDHAYIAKVNWRDNPWFPDVLAIEKDHLFKIDPDLAMHVWEGHCRTNSAAQIFKDKWLYQDFEIVDNWNGPYLGADWGFSQDPSTLIEMYINPFERNLMIRREAWEIGVELDDIPNFYDSNIPCSRKVKIRADNARPETISFVNRQGYDIEAARKWSGSVEDGVDFLKTFNKIIIHTDCPHTRDEAKNYSYKVDRLTGDVLRGIVDQHNHCFDACRYGLDPLITASGLGILDVL